MTAQPQIQQQMQKPLALEPLTPEQIQRVIELLDEWMLDDSGYDEETWPELKESLDKERNLISARRLFSE